MDNYIYVLQRQKRPTSFAAHLIIKKWHDSGRTDQGMGMCTFKHIINYMSWNQVDKSRLPVALADYGFTLEELDSALKEGKTAKDIAAEIIARGVDDDDDE